MQVSSELHARVTFPQGPTNTHWQILNNVMKFMTQENTRDALSHDVKAITLNFKNLEEVSFLIWF
jgi:hypothetical protein